MKATKAFILFYYFFVISNFYPGPICTGLPVDPAIY